MYLKGIITGLLIAAYFQLLTISNVYVSRFWYAPFFIWIILIALSALLFWKGSDRHDI